TILPGDGSLASNGLVLATPAVSAGTDDRWIESMRPWMLSRVGTRTCAKAGTLTSTRAPTGLRHDCAAFAITSGEIVGRIFRARSSSCLALNSDPSPVNARWT